MPPVICMSCSFFRIQSESTGLCRVDSVKKGQGPVQVGVEDSCDRWRDSGQQYYIRIGWIKSQHQKKQ